MEPIWSPGCFLGKTSGGLQYVTCANYGRIVMPSVRDKVSHQLADRRAPERAPPWCPFRVLRVELIAVAENGIILKLLIGPAQVRMRR